MVEIDLHGLELWQALEEIVYKLEECKTIGIREITRSILIQEIFIFIESFRIFIIIPFIYFFEMTCKGILLKFINSIEIILMKELNQIIKIFIHKNIERLNIYH